MSHPASETKESLTPEERDRFYTLLHENDDAVHNRIVICIFRRVSNLDVFDDLYQNILLAGLRKFHQLKDDKAFGKWLEKIAKNRINKYFKRKKLEKDGLRIVAENAIDPTGVSSHSKEKEESHDEEHDIEKKIREIIKTFPEFDARCFELHFFEKMTYDQIAAKLETSVRTVQRSMNRTKAKLRKRKDEIGCILVLLGVDRDHFLDLSRKVYEQSLDLPVEAAATAGVSASVSWFQAVVSSVAGVVGHAFVTILFMLSSILLWLFSVLMGGQYYGLRLVLNARSLELRRWLVRQLFFAYCGAAATPLYIYYVVRIGVLYVLKTPDWVTTTGLMIGILPLCWLAFFAWTWKEYRRASTDSSWSSKISYRGLCGLVYVGFPVFTVALVLLANSWWHVIMAPGLEFATQRNLAALRFTHLVAAFGIGGLILWFHVSSFFLARYLLRISRDDESLAKTPPPFDAETANERAVQILQGLLCGTGLLFVSFPNIAHIIVYGRRIVAPILEISVACLAWYVALKLYREKPEKRLLLMFGLLLAEVVFMYALRRWIYD